MAKKFRYNAFMCGGWLGWDARLLRRGTPAARAAIDREAGGRGKQAAAYGAGAPVILGRMVVVLVKRAPDRRAAALAAKMDGLVGRVSPHFMPVVIEHRTDATAEIAHDDGAVLLLILEAHVIPPRITTRDTAILRRVAHRQQSCLRAYCIL